MRKGDTIRVAKQPSNQWVGIVGEVGVIDEIKDDYAQIDTFDLKRQKQSGSGSVPIDCLEPYSDSRLRAALETREREMAATLAACEARQKKWSELVRKVATENGISCELAEKVMEIGRSF